MTKSTITREQLLEIIETDHVQCGEASYLARIALAAIDSKPVALHMGEAINVFNALKGEQLSERVNNTDTGLMGASNVQVWTSKTGGRLEFISANGGCTLNIFPQPAPVVPDELLKEYLRLVDCMLSDYRDSNYGDAQRWIRHIADASDTFEEKHGLSPWEMARKNFRAAMLNGGNDE